MKSYTITAFIIKIKLLQEADHLVVLLTPTGRIETVAKGLGKLKSHKTGQIDLLNLVKIKLYRTANLHLITEVELVDDYAELKSNLSQIQKVFLILEILDRFTTIDEADDDKYYNELSEFLLLTKQFVNTEPNKLSLLFNAFSLHILRIAGFEPAMSTYLGTENAIKPDQKRIAAASGEAGYLAQGQIDSTYLDPVLVTDDILKIQKYLLAHDLQEATRLDVSPAQNSHLESIHITWLEGILERRLESRKMKIER